MKKQNLLIGCLFLGFLWMTQATIAQRVNTVAGQAGVTGDLDGPGRSTALFNNPHGIAADAQGNIYVADRFNHKIRKMTPAGIVTTLAGTGEVGGADGTGNTATFHEPWGLTATPDGTLFIADTKNHRIRKIDTAGNVSTFAGTGVSGVVDGPGSSAFFASPSGISLDENGNLYVCDHLGHTIRKISPGGYVSTLAGSAFVTGRSDGLGTAATFNRPYGIEVDRQGNVLVADEWNHLIRLVTPAGLVTTFAGTGALGSLDGIKTTAEFNYPWDVAVDTLGNVFVMDGDNHVIRKISMDDSVMTYVGEAGQKGAIDGLGNQASFNGATSLCFDPNSGDLFVADAYNDLIRRVIADTTASSGSGGGGGTDALFLTVAGWQAGDSLCPGTTITVMAQPEAFEVYAYYLNGNLMGSTSNNNFQLTLSEPGLARLQVKGLDGQGLETLSQVFSLVVRELPPLDFSYEVLSSQSGYQVRFQANAPLSSQLTWDFGDAFAGAANTGMGQSPEFLYLRTGLYSVNLFAVHTGGCQDTLTKSDFISYGDIPPPSPTAESAIFIPNAFSPNGDGLNDILFVRGSNIAELDMKIYNEWGEMIFLSQSPADGWDGTRAGKIVQPDTYICIARIILTDGSSQVIRSQITVLR